MKKIVSELATIGKRKMTVKKRVVPARRDDSLMRAAYQAKSRTDGIGETMYLQERGMVLLSRSAPEPASRLNLANFIPLPEILAEATSFSMPVASFAPVDGFRKICR